VKKLIVNADDYNLTPGCDRAIEHAVGYGVVTSTSCLVWDRAPVIPPVLTGRVGLHLRLTDGSPVLSPLNVPTLVDQEGYFPRSRAAVQVRNVDPKEVRAEWLAQIALMDPLAVPDRLAHLDTHHHSHSIPGIDRVYEDLCVEFGCAGVPLSAAQRDRLRARGVRCPSFTEIRWTDGKYQTLEKLLEEDFAKHDSVHLMTHPGSADDALRKVSTMVEVREQEELVLTVDGRIRTWLDRYGIKLIAPSELDVVDPLAKVDLIYLTWNRRAFTEASMAALRANTDWSLVRQVTVYDDGSTDGTLDLVMRFCTDCPVPCYSCQTNLRSPVATMNMFLTSAQPTPWFVKLDSDVIVPPGWLGDCIATLRRWPHVDLLGLEAKNDPVHAPARRAIESTDHIGGIGLMRTSAFTELPVAAGRLGFSDWQIKHDVTKVWLNPSLPVILLDRLPFEPWSALSAEYEAKGWQRPWKRYAIGENVLWNWWLKL
jgi:predicted glycoside hydrolase/deacetylase ChbG (UPF0249 family)